MPSLIETNYTLHALRPLPLIRSKMNRDEKTD